MLATAILTTPQPSSFLIDEPHAFLHPLAERGLLRFIQQHPEHQYIIATHSPAFLRSYPIGQTRLITIEDDGSHISAVHDEAHVLAGVGITAADLWSSDSVLWVEGPSDADIIRSIAKSDVSGTPVTVVPMADIVRNSPQKPRTVRELLEFCDVVTKALLPVQVRMSFLFDSDEKKLEIKNQIETASRGTARFLTVRELENLFLDAASIHADLATQCQLLGIIAPTLEDAEAELASELEKIGDAELYPPRRDPNYKPTVSEDLVVGSKVLQRLYRKWLLADYSKVDDGLRLAKQVQQHAPDRLNQLTAIIADLAR